MRRPRFPDLRDVRAALAKASRASTAQVVAELFPGLAINIADVGARWGSTGAWYRVPPLGKVCGFEPDEAECARLNELAGPNERYFPVALGASNGDAELTVTVEPACSSLLPPIADVIERYPALHSVRPVRRQRVQLRRLDSLAREEAWPAFHVMKLDTQGTELDVIRGAGTLLKDVLCLEVEVEFNPIYAGQPLYGDVDATLREHGLSVWRFRTLAHYAERPATTRTSRATVQYDGRRVHHTACAGRLYWAEAVFMRDPAFVRDDDVDALLRLAALFDALGEDDGMLHCLARLAAQRTLPAATRRALERHARHCDK